MAATADPRAKPPATPPTHHLEPWAHQQPRHAHRTHVLPAVASSVGGASAARDRRRSPSHRRGGGGATATAQVVGEESYDGGIEDLRAKLMGHLRDAAGRLRVPQPSPPPPSPPPPQQRKAVSPPPETEPEPELRAPPPPSPPPTQQPQVDVAERPWKLRERTRRRPAALTSWPRAPPPPSYRRRKRAPFSVTLTTEEIEEDLYALTGSRPRRRPRKRPRVVQRQLDSLFPGLWLTEINADDYRVPDE